MKPPTTTASLVLLLAWGACSCAATADDGLAIRIVLPGTPGTSVIDFDEPLRIVLTNTTDQTIRIRDPDPPTGDQQVSLEWVNRRTGARYLSRKRESANGGIQETNEDDSGSGVVEIEPAETVTLQQYLGTHTWSGLPAPNSGDHFTISAVFESSVARTGSGAQIWTGEIRSEPITAQFTANGISTPHDYLWERFPARALEIMQADPTWVSRRDEDARTPLHIAARFGNIEVVEWLLKHGADVNATAYNSFTPLHLTDDPEVVALILKYKPDLNIRGPGETILQDAVANLMRARNDRDRQKWQTIVDMYFDAGADYDILTAINLDDLDRVKEILERSPESAERFQGRSPLRTAASRGRLEICRYLIEERHVDVKGVDSVIVAAVRWPEILRLLIENGADLQWRENLDGQSGIWAIGNDATALHFAADYGVPESIDLLIDHGVDIFAVAHPPGTDREQTAPDVAATWGSTDNAVALLNRPEFARAEESYRQELLNRCLLSAARRDRPEGPGVVEVLLEAGADPDAHDENGDTAIRLAAERIFPRSHPDGRTGNPFIRQTVAILREHGATIDLFTAVAIGDDEAVAGLLEQDPDLADSYSPRGYPALHVAVKMNDADSLKLLLKAGADVDIRYGGETALHWAARRGLDAIARLLIDAGADVNAAAERQCTPLHSAAGMTNVKVARLLLEHGAQIDARDANGETPLDWCDEFNGQHSDGMRKLFAEYGQSVDP